MNAYYLEPSQEAGADLFSWNIAGPVVMLNMLRLREVADYTKTPELAPQEPISGSVAFQWYVDHTLPFLTQSGGE